MSIVRIGLSEKAGFSEGYEAIFGKKKNGEKKAEPAAKKPADKPAKKKPAKKK